MLLLCSTGLLVQPYRCRNVKHCEQAKSRVEVTQRKIQNESKRKKDHVGDISKFNFDEESCIHEVNSYNENDEN